MIFKWRKGFKIATVIMSNLGGKYYKIGKKEGITEDCFMSVIIYAHILKDFRLKILKAFLQLFLSFIYFIRIISLQIKQLQEF